MEQSFTFTKASLVKLLDAVLYPNPDDPDSPIGPVTRALTWILLNPQPLPPVAGPHPEPWRSAFLARMVIDQAVAQYRLAEILSTGEQSEKAFEVVRSVIHEFVDDYCGNRPLRWPFPWPLPLRWETVQIGPLDLLTAGAQFQKAADAMADKPLQANFSAAANQLFEAGLRRMESG
jgi:hypothetical protein